MGLDREGPIIVGLGERKYEIHVGMGCMEALGRQMRETISECRVLVVTNSTIDRLHGEKVRASLHSAGYEAEVFEIPDREAAKSLDTVAKIWDHLVHKGYPRQSTLVALGGGVVGDVTGFAAACYMRGIDCVQAPTTLLAMVDSSVGGKTGVNHPHAKNMIGAFRQPKLVFIDLALLKTLPPEEFRSGFAEVIKHGVIRDGEYFSFLEENLEAIFALDAAALAHTVKVSCEIKAAVVAADEREEGLRAILNFGHTLGHAIEALGGYGAVRHGEAVGIGMVGEARIAKEMGMISEGEVKRIHDLLLRSNLPIRIPDQPVVDLLDRMKSDKKVRDGRVRFVLPTRIGAVEIRDDVPGETVVKVIQEMGATPP